MNLIDTKQEKLHNAIVFFAKNTKLCGLTKLMKLLYYLDFIHYRQTGRSVTGRTYYAWDMGPVPVDVYFEITGKEDKGLSLNEIAVLIPKGENFRQVKAKEKFNEDVFTPRELKILRLVADMFKDANADLMVESTHLKNHPWEKTIREKGNKAIIDYDLALDNSPDQLDGEIIRERQAEINEVKRLFS